MTPEPSAPVPDPTQLILGELRAVRREVAEISLALRVDGPPPSRTARAFDQGAVVASDPWVLAGAAIVAYGYSRGSTLIMEMGALLLGWSIVTAWRGVD